LPLWARPTIGDDGQPVPRDRQGRKCGLVSAALSTDLAAAIKRADALNEALAQ
jgi:hypothetical protein